MSGVGNPGSQIEALWRQFLDLTSRIVIPDWGELIGLFPLLLVIGVLGPVVTLLALAWFRYAVRRPRPKVRIGEDSRRVGPPAGGTAVA